jgi:hypothetical protein
MAEKCSICGKSGIMMGGYTCFLCERRICKAHPDLRSSQATIDTENARLLMLSEPSSVRGKGVARETNNGALNANVIVCPDCLKWLSSAKKTP